MAQQMHEVVAANVRRELQARGWSQIELARRCGLPASRITDLLKGHYRGRIKTLERIAAGFGVPVAALMLPPSDEKI